MSALIFYFYFPFFVLFFSPSDLFSFFIFLLFLFSFGLFLSFVWGGMRRAGLGCHSGWG
jgi:hypothetical protein